MTGKRWFLPETPDVLGMLRRQMAVAIDGVDAFARWAGGDAAAAQAVRDAEYQGDVAKRDLLSALREAFVTPSSPRICSRCRAGSTASSTMSPTS